jgi:hypothetical protein
LHARKAICFGFLFLGQYAGHGYFSLIASVLLVEHGLINIVVEFVVIDAGIHAPNSFCYR